MELEPQLQDEPILNYFRHLFVILVFSKKNKTLCVSCLMFMSENVDNYVFLMWDRLLLFKRPLFLTTFITNTEVI